MKVSLDLEFLKKHKLTPNQFLILEQLTHSANTTLVKKLFEDMGIEEIKEFEELIEKGFLTKNRTAYYITEDFLEIFHNKDAFDELLEVYPDFVMRPDGYKSNLKSDLTRCRTKYGRITRNRKDIHDYIMSCLRFEVSNRKATNSLSYMKTLTKWLDTEGWTEWENKIKQQRSTVVEDATYGTDLL